MTNQNPKHPDFKDSDSLRAEGYYDTAFFDALWPDIEPTARYEREEIITNAGYWYLNLQKSNPVNFTNKAQNDLIKDLGKKAGALHKAYENLLGSHMAISKLYGGLSEEYEASNQYIKQIMGTIIQENNGIDFDRSAIGAIAKTIENACEHGAKIDRVREGGESGIILLSWVKEMQKHWKILQLSHDEFSVGEYFKKDKGKGRGIRNNDTAPTLLKIISIIDPSIRIESIETAMRKATSAS